MQRMEIENRLNELKNCKYITIGHSGNKYQTVLYSDIINLPEGRMLLYKIDNTLFYYTAVTILKPSPLDAAL